MVNGTTVRWAYLKHTPLHQLNPLPIPLQPPLRPERLSILPKNSPMPMQHPSIHRHSRAPRQLNTVNLRPSLRHLPRNIQSHSRSNTHGFLQTSLKIRQILRFVVLHHFRQIGGQDFRDEFLPHFAVREDVPEEALHRGCGGVTPCEDGAVGDGEDVSMPQGLGVFSLRDD